MRVRGIRARGWGKVLSFSLSSFFIVGAIGYRVFC